MNRSTNLSELQEMSILGCEPPSDYSFAKIPCWAVRQKFETMQLTGSKNFCRMWLESSRRWIVRGLFMTSLVALNFSSLLASNLFLQDATISTLDGTEISGQVTALDESKLSMQVDGIIKDFSLSDIGTMRFGGAKGTANERDRSDAASTGNPLVTWDGSKLLGVTLVGKGSDWQLQSPTWSTLAPVNSKQLHYWQLKKIEPSQETGWNEAVADVSQSDGLILARPNGEITKVSGTILEMKEGKVTFEFDDQRLEMAIEKLAGMAWFQPTPPRVQPSVEVRTIDGSVWNASKLAWADDRLRIDTAVGIRVVFDPSKIAEIRFGSANVQWLAEVEKIEASAAPGYSWKFTVDAASKAFVPRFVSASNGASAQGKNDLVPSEQDLLFTRPGTYTFRMPEGFRKLEARVERTKDGEVRSPLTIQVWQDAEKVSEQQMPGDQQSIVVKAELASEKRIKLVVLSDAPTQLGTEVQWKQPRLLR